MAGRVFSSPPPGRSRCPSFSRKTWEFWIRPWPTLSLQMVAVDLEKLKAAILRLARDEKLRFRMGGAAKSKALTYRWSNLIPPTKDFGGAERGIPPLRPQSRRAPNILSGDFSSTFSHYPSRRLSGKQEIRLTDYGSQILKDCAKPVRYEDVQVCLFPDLERFLLDSLLQQPQSVANLRELSRKSLDATKGRWILSSSGS